MAAHAAPELVFCDLDDTFLARDKHIPARNLAALDMLAEAGASFVPATGRAYAGIPSELLEHPAVRYAMSATGAVVTDARTGEAVFSRPVGAERALALFELAGSLEVTFDLFADGRIWAERARHARLPEMGIDEQQLALMLRTRSVYDEPLAERAATLERIDRVGVFVRAGAAGERDRERVLAAVAQVSGLRAIAGHPLGLEIMDAGVSKGAALEWLCGHTGTPIARSVAFGDSGNDVDLLKAAGCGVAMANASPAALAAADAVTDLDCDVGGVGDRKSVV